MNYGGQQQQPAEPTAGPSPSSPASMGQGQGAAGSVPAGVIDMAARIQDLKSILATYQDRLRNVGALTGMVLNAVAVESEALVNGALYVTSPQFGGVQPAELGDMVLSVAQEALDEEAEMEAIATDIASLQQLVAYGRILIDEVEAEVAAEAQTAPVPLDGNDLNDGAGAEGGADVEGEQPTSGS